MFEWWSEMLQDPTRVGVVAAWFTGGAAIISVIISAVVSTIVSRRSVYINAVTAERSKWIETLRGTVSKMSAAADRVVTLRQEKPPIMRTASSGQLTLRSYTGSCPTSRFG